MPWYEYKCGKCGKVFEKQSSMSEAMDQYPCGTDGCGGIAYKVLGNFHISRGAPGLDSPELALNDKIAVPGLIVEKDDFPAGLPESFDKADAAFVTSVDNYNKAVESSKQKRDARFRASENPEGN